jgi:two-component system, chemotaxis family, response regulator Rcp1
MRNYIEVLHIEDDGDHVDLVKTAASMAKLPLKITSVVDGEEGLQYLNNQGRFADAVRPHLIILDLALSHMDGMDVLTAIRQNPELGKISLVILTNRDLSPDVMEKNFICDEYLYRKPIGINGYVEVMKEIENYFEREHSESAAN